MSWLDGWKDDAEVCGNCKHWALGGYQHDWPGCAPSGNSGHHCNGDEGECRRHAPSRKTPEFTASRNAIWPETNKFDHCGEFEKRAQSFRRQRAEYKPTDITGAPQNEC